MNWKNSLREIKKQKAEFHDYIKSGEKEFSVEILDSNNKRLEVDSYSFRIYRESDSQVGVYLEQVVRVEGEVSFYSRIPSNDEDYEDEDFIKKMKFKFDKSDEFDIGFVVNLRQTSELVLELNPKGDLMMKYENGKLTLEQLAMTYEAAK